MDSNVSQANIDSLPPTGFRPIEPNIVVTVKPTDKQRDLLEFIHAYIHEAKHEPSLTQLAKWMRIKLASAFDHKALLRKKGYLLGWKFCPHCGERL